MDSLILKPLAKGQITIPKLFRNALGIDETTYFKAELKKDKIILSPLTSLKMDQYVRTYTNKQIKEFLRSDKLTSELRKKAKNLLKS